MKNLKIILAFSFVIPLMITHTAFAIILTGPARRQAHREQAEQAYDQENLDGLQENYADDANIVIQTLGQGSIGASLTPEEKAFVQQKLETKLKEARMNSSQNVVTQAIEEHASAPTPTQTSSSESATPTNSLPVTPTVTETPAEHPAVAQTATPVLPIPEVVSTPHPDEKQVSESAHDKAVVEPLTHAAQAGQAMVAAVQSQESVPVVTPMPVTPEIHPVVATPIQAPQTQSTAEQVKIVKVYPVYDAVIAAFTNMKSVAQDMASYAYTMFSAPAKKQEQPEVKNTEPVKTA